MKKIFTLFTLCLSFGLSAQQTSNLVVFSEDASLFYIIVNGIKQNIEPKSNVKITGLTSNNNQVLIQFADEKRGSLKKNIYFQEMGVEATAKITYTKKGYKLRYFGEVPISSAPPASPNQWTTSYSTTEVTSTNSQSTTNTSTTQTNQNSGTGSTTFTNNTATTNTSTTNNNTTTTVNTNTTPTPTPVTNTSTTTSNAVDMNYLWSAGSVYRFSTVQVDDVSTSMMGMSMKDKFTTTTEFALHILNVQANGTANGVLYLIDFKVTDSKNAVLASINDIPADAVKSDVSVDKKGKFTFLKQLTLITTNTGNVLAYVKTDGNGVGLGGQAGDMQVDAYAEFDPKTGQLKASYKVTELKNTKKVNVKITEETDQIDVLPYDYLELLALPEGGIAQGDKVKMQTGIYNTEITATKVENGTATLNYKMKTDKSKDQFSSDIKATDGNGNTQMEMNTNQMFDMNSMMTQEDKDAMNSMKGMSPDITCDINSDFSYALGMFQQVSGVMTTSMNAMGVQLSVVSNLMMKKL